MNIKNEAEMMRAASRPILLCVNQVDIPSLFRFQIGRASISVSLGVAVYIIFLWNMSALERVRDKKKFIQMFYNLYVSYPMNLLQAIY